MRHLSIGDLANLMVAWAEGEVSEGRLVEVTGLDRTTLRNLRLTAVEAGIALVQRTPEDLAELQSRLTPTEPGDTTLAPES